MTGRSQKPHPSTIAALARVLGVQPADLDGANVPSDAPARSMPAEIQEVDLRRVDDAGGDFLKYRPQLALWSVPADLLAARGLQADRTVVLRAQGGLEGVAAGDRLIVDLTQRSLYPPGLAVIWIEESGEFDLVRIGAPSRGVSGRDAGGMSVSLEFGWGSVSWAPSDVHVVGRVVAKWAWG
ncbi:Helix-turn-helix transcriptional regulator (plasmid) [Rhodovastum atsumiense]|nr:Helix-turn-helix transcriptional regulator [Rhodovastum atsumiense]